MLWPSFHSHAQRKKNDGQQYATTNSPIKSLSYEGVCGVRQGWNLITINHLDNPLTRILSCARSEADLDQTRS